MTSKLTLHCFKGPEILEHLHDLAQLRISVFKEYPYLYQGSMAYETQYLKVYSDCPESFMVIVFDGNTVVGASTAIPLEFETDEFKAPFRKQHFNINTIFYLGESVLLPRYRGNKLYRHFFMKREQAAQRYGSQITAFCAVARDAHDPRRPPNFKPLDPIWQHFGYTKHPELITELAWQDVGEALPSMKPMIFWLKNI